jgi:hypothetical protein
MAMTEREWLGTCINEAEWLACRSVQRPEMPDNLGYCWQRCGLLFAVACCRSVWHLLPKDQASRNAVVTAEAHADGLQGREELMEAEQKAYEAAESLMEQIPDLEWKRSPTWHAMWAAASFTGAMSGRRPVSGAGHHTQYAIAWEKAPQPNRREEREAIRQLEGQRQWSWVLDIFGNPFRPVSLAPAWLTPAVLKLAQAAYNNRFLPSGLLDNAALAVLADALEEGGCTDADILSHLRAPGEHVRGCWPLDMVLGKE